MNYRMVLRNLGTLALVNAACLLLSLACALFYGERGVAADFLRAAAVAGALGGALRLVPPRTTDIYPKDGFAIVGFGWLLSAAIGALPYLLTGALASPVDAVFESVSSLSTTAATVIPDVAALPQGVMFWRCFSQWVGGLGFLVLVMAILPSARANMYHVMRAESPGPAPNKFVPQIGHVARILYAIYVGMTAALAAMLMAGGLEPFDAVMTAFSTASTGGFTDVGGDLSAFGNPFAEAAVCAFMLLFGANFSLYFQAFSKRDARAFLRDEELRFYLGAIAAATGLIATANALAGVFPSALESLRQAAFHTVSVITTTGFTTTDYGAWPTFSQALLILLMFVGAMGGSTGGGIKCVRVLLLVKIARREVRRIIHPRSVKALRLNGKAVEEGVLSSIVVFFFLYMAILGVAVLLVSAEGGGLLTAMTAVLACLSNIGPGSGVVGFEGSFAAFSGFGKGVLSFCMFVGRLEIYPVLLLASPAFWKKVNI